MNFQQFLTYVLPFWVLLVNVLTAAPVITDISPAFGPATGGTLVTITGTGFTGVTSVSFGDTVTPFFVSSSTTITVASPAHVPQVVTVAVTAVSGTSPATIDSYFTYQGNWLGYTGNTADPSTSSIFDTTLLNVLASPSVGTNPVQIGITPDGSEAYVANADDNTVSIIDAATRTVIATVAVGTGPDAVTFLPDGSLAYVSNGLGNNISVIDTETHTVVTTITVGSQPAVMTLLTDGTKGYVANYDDGTVSVINTATNSVTATLTVGLGPLVIAIGPDGSTAYVGNSGEDTVSVIDTATDTVTATVTVGNTPNGIATSFSRVYVTNYDDATLSVINPSDNTILATIPVGDLPSAVVVGGDDRAYVTNFDSNTVSVINTNLLIETTQINVGINPSMLALNPDKTRLFVTNFGDNTVSVIDIVNDPGVVIATLPVGASPDPISITADQAPLAKFTVSGGVPFGAPFIFDASESNSPTGTIVNYSWDFGDGSTFDTPLPTVAHSYTTPGTVFPVTLTVTNSAGTSTTQIFDLSSNSGNNGGQTSLPLLKNGGPTASYTFDLVLELPPPIEFTGCIKKNKFLNKTEYILKMTWIPSFIPGAVAYRIYNGTTLVGTVPATAPLFFETCLTSKSSAENFSIASVDALGLEGPRLPIQIVGSGCCNNFR